MTNPTTPASLESHAAKYNKDAWKEYSPAELGQWVHLFLKRASHRSDLDKAEKDLTDASNYADMLKAHIDATKEELKFRRFLSKWAETDQYIDLMEIDLLMPHCELKLIHSEEKISPDWIRYHSEDHVSEIVAARQDIIRIAYETHPDRIAVCTIVLARDFWTICVSPNGIMAPNSKFAKNS